MLEVINYPLFVVTAVTLNLYPGPDTLYILGRSAAQGRMAGLVSALGIASGALVHSVLGALGLSALLMTSATAYQVVKWAGAAYLIYLGLGMLSARTGQGVRTTPPQSLGRIYRQGLLANLLNPKVALFFLALIPQFVAPGATCPGAAFLALGLTFVATGTMWCLLIAVVGGMLNAHLSGRGVGTRWLKRLSGALLVGLGVRLGFSDMPVK